jgi:hypothetical protein
MNVLINFVVEITEDKRNCDLRWIENSIILSFIKLKNIK